MGRAIVMGGGGDGVGGWVGGLREGGVEDGVMRGVWFLVGWGMGEKGRWQCMLLRDGGLDGLAKNRVGIGASEAEPAILHAISPPL